jgi:hypothetical protein
MIYNIGVLKRMLCSGETNKKGLVAANPFSHFKGA